MGLALLDVGQVRCGDAASFRQFRLAHAQFRAALFAIGTQRQGQLGCHFIELQISRHVPFRPSLAKHQPMKSGAYSVPCDRSDLIRLTTFPSLILTWKSSTSNDKAYYAHLLTNNTHTRRLVPR